jgi:hypothetical protein
VVGWISSWPSEALAALTAATRAQVSSWFLTGLTQPDALAASSAARSTRLRFLWEQAMAPDSPEFTERVAALFATLPALATEESYPIPAEDTWRHFGGLIDNLEDHTLWLTRRDGLQALLTPEPPSVPEEDPPVVDPVEGDDGDQGDEGDGDAGAVGEEADEGGEDKDGGQSTDGDSGTDDGGRFPAPQTRP